MKIFEDQPDHRSIVNLIADRDKPAKSYYLLIGPQGVGKTVLTTLATKSAEKGVMYVESSDESSFRKNLSREIRKINYLGYLWIIYRDWNVVFHKFEKIAEVKRKNKQYTSLLIIDNVKISDGSSSEYRKMLRNIQHSAKAAMEHGNYSVMFVTNDQKTLEFFLDDTAESRMEIIYLGDLDKDVALSYLRNHRIDRNTAEKVYEIVGGRIIDLSHIVKHFERNKNDKYSLNGPLIMKPNSITNKLYTCLSRYQNSQNEIFEFLHNHSDRTFSRSEFIMENQDWGGIIYDELIRRNILTVAKNLKTTFGSPATKYVFENLFKDKKV